MQRAQHPDPKFQDEERAIKYKGLKSKQQREFGKRSMTLYTP